MNVLKWFFQTEYCRIEKRNLTWLISMKTAVRIRLLLFRQGSSIGRAVKECKSCLWLLQQSFFHYKVRVDGSNPSLATAPVIGYGKPIGTCSCSSLQTIYRFKSCRGSYVVLTAIILDITANYEPLKHHENYRDAYSNLI